MSPLRHPRIDPIRLPLNDKWLDWAIDAAGGEELFVAEIKLQIARRSSGSSRAQNRFLDDIGARGLWRGAVSARTGRIRDRATPPPVDDRAARHHHRYRTSSLEQWPGGSRVVVVIGR